jgi:DNA-binding response OmpR family regulator
VSPADRRVIALGNLVGELKTSLESATTSAGAALVLTREPAKALIELERASAVAVLVDMATLGAEQFCKRARGTERLRGVPIIGMSRTPSELGFARVFAWGADDLVPLGATPALERRLKALVAADPSEHTSFGQAVVAEGTTQRRALLGRVLVHAGSDVKFAVDRGSVELYSYL